MRGGLDDALDKLARRDELRRRAAGEATGTPPAVTELVEAIAAVVAHHPQLGVTVGVEGAGDPLLLRFYFGDGQVQVNAENAVVARPDDPEPAGPRHADFDVEADSYEPTDQPYEPTDRSHGPTDRSYEPVDQSYGPADRSDHDNPDHLGRAGFGYESPAPAHDRYHAESDTAERRYGSFDAPPDPRYADLRPGEASGDLGARLRDLGMASRHAEPEYPPHPFAPPPRPEVPPQSRTAGPYAPPTPFRPMPTQPTSAQPTSAQPASAQPTSSHPVSSHPVSGRPVSGQPVSGRPTSAQPMSAAPTSGRPGPAAGVPPRSEHGHAEFTRTDRAEPTLRIPPGTPPWAAAEHLTTDRIPHQAQPPGQRATMPSPLPKPIPLKVERPEETEMAARRLAALLRDDPSLLNQPPD